MSCCNPDTIGYAYPKTGHKILPGTFQGNHIGTEDENGNPEVGFVV